MFLFLFLDFRTFFKISIFWRGLVFVVLGFNLAVLRARSDCGTCINTDSLGNCWYRMYDVHASINRFYSHGEQDFERYPGPARRAGVVSLRKGRSTVNGNKGSVMYTVINI